MVWAVLYSRMGHSSNYLGPLPKFCSFVVQAYFLTHIFENHNWKNENTFSAGGLSQREYCFRFHDTKPSGMFRAVENAMQLFSGMTTT